MKHRPLFLLSLATITVTFFVLFALLSARQKLSLALLKYTRWPHGALLLLSNGTPNTIRYLSEHNETPAGNLVLYLQETSGGWTNSSLEIRSITGINPTTRKGAEFFYVVDPAASPKPRDFLHVLQSRDLGPGQSVEFFVLLEPGRLPRKVGTVCYLPQNALEKKLQPWLQRLQQWCRMNTKPPGQREVWCPSPLSIPSEPNRSVGN